MGVEVVLAAAALPAVAAPVVVATLVVALAQRQLSPVAAHALVAEVSAD